jgi:hypothetical protein
MTHLGIHGVGAVVEGQQEGGQIAIVAVGVDGAIFYGIAVIAVHVHF